MDNKLSELKAVAEKYRSTFAEHRKKPRDYDALDAWDKATSEFVESVNNDELNIISFLLDKLENEEGYRKGAFLACNRWHDKFRESEAKLEAAEQRIAELENDEIRQRLANAEHQLHMAELRANNARAGRIAQFRKRKAAEKRLAMPVRLPEPNENDYGYQSISYLRVIYEIKNAGFTVEGDKDIDEKTT